MLDLGMYDETAYCLEKVYEDQELPINFFSSITIPERLPDHPALQKALGIPELQALFDIRRGNLGLTNGSD